MLLKFRLCIAEKVTHQKSARKRLFLPVSAKRRSTELENRHTLEVALRDSIPNAVFYTSLAGYKPLSSSLVANVICELPPTITEIALRCGDVADFLSQLTTSETQRRSLESITREQSDCQEWMEARRGRITASMFHAVNSKAESIKKNTGRCDTHNLVSRLMGVGTDLGYIDAVQWGKKQERAARMKYRLLERSNHVKFHVETCGIYIDEHDAFLACSPDGIVSCECHGKGVLEIKCPKSISMQVPGPANLPYLTSCNSSVAGPILKHNHPYYFQCQGQMAITGLKYCHFFVYTLAGTVLVNVEFDPIFWEHLKGNLNFFFLNHLVPEIMSRKTLTQDLTRGDTGKSK